MNTPPKIHTFEAVALAVLFAAAITLPLVKQLTGEEPDTSSTEMRILSPKPDFGMSWKSRVKFLPGEIENYYSDHFGFRFLLLETSSFLNLRLFHFSQRAQIGEDGCMFYKLHPPLFSRSLGGDDLAKWKSYLENRQQWLAARGIKYLFVVPPDKDSIYPELLPYTSRPPPQELPVDQLIRYLKETHSTVEVLSLREPLLAAKKQEREFLYFKQDGHWNNLGGFYGYQAIIQYLVKWFPALKAKSRADYRLTLQARQVADVALQAALFNFTDPVAPVLEPVVPNLAQKTPLNFTGFAVKPFKTQLPGAANLPHAVMMRDSFTISLAPYLSESFGNITYFWPAHPLENEKVMADTLNKDKPDIFIEERIQRFIFTPPDESIVFGGVEQTGPGAKNP